MTTLATIRQAMTAFLAEAGIEALSAWPKEVWKGRKTPVAVVQVKEVEGRRVRLSELSGADL